MNREPLLIINVELNLPYRPQIVIFKDSNIDTLVEQFILDHDSKPTAIAIIRQLILDNMKSKPIVKTHHKNYTEWKSLHQREKSKQNIQKINKHKVVRKQSPRQGLLQMPFCNNNTENKRNININSKSKNKSSQIRIGSVQKQFEKQFKRIKLQRTLVRQEQHLKQIYRKLTKQNPASLNFITPQFIDFTNFTAEFLTILQDFFEVLNQQDFIELDFQKFKKLIEKYHFAELFKIQKKFS